MVLFSFLFFISSSIGSFNTPEVKWYTLKTAHFNVVYEEGMDSVAVEVLEILEGVYDTALKSFHLEEIPRVDVVICGSDDVFNGWATFVGNKIVVYPYPLFRYAGGEVDWVRRIVLHEFAHILTFHAIALTGLIHEILLSFELLPLWFVEGIAQYFAESWDVHRDLFTRASVLSDSLVPLDRLGYFYGKNAIEARLVYEEGHGMVRWLVAKYGEDVIPRILEKFRVYKDFGLALKKVTGLKSGELYRKWKRSLMVYAGKVEYLLGLDGKHLATPFKYTAGVAFSPVGNIKACVGFSNEEEFQTSLAVFSSKELYFVIDGPEVGPQLSFSPDGRYLAYSKKDIYGTGHFYSDIYVFDIKARKRLRLTKGERACDPDFSPDGRSIVCVMYEKDRACLLYTSPSPRD